MTDSIVSLDEYDNKINTEYTIISSDNENLVVDTTWFKNSDFLNVLLSDKETRSINLNFNSDLLKDVFEYLEFASTNETTMIDEVIMDTTLKTVVNEWELNYLKKIIEKKTISHMIKVANYLGIVKLLHLLCGQIAALIKNKKPEEIKSIINEITI